MQPTVILFHWTSCIGAIQSLFLACVNPPTLMRAVYTGSTLANVYYYSLSAQLKEPSRQTMRLYVPEDEQRTIVLSRVAKWTSRGLHVVAIVMDVTYIALIDNIWLSMMMFVATGFYPALKLLRRCAPEINLNARPKQDLHETQYSLLDDGDHRDAVQQRFMLKQLPRMLAMIALGACHMALMLDVRNTCATMNANASNVLNWMC
jgi:hypothetical protein